MSIYVKKPEEYEAITFDELVDYGKKNSANIVKGMPWSFDYKSHPISHETDECYLIPTPWGSEGMTPKDMLVSDPLGNLYPLDKDVFNTQFQLKMMCPLIGCECERYQEQCGDLTCDDCPEEEKA